MDDLLQSWEERQKAELENSHLISQICVLNWPVSGAGYVGQCCECPSVIFGELRWAPMLDIDKIGGECGYIMIGFLFLFT